MNITKLKIGKKVWVHNGEFPIHVEILSIDENEGEVWCDDGWNHDVDYIYSSKQRCVEFN